MQAERTAPSSSTAIDLLCAGLARQILRHFPDGWGAILDRSFCHLLVEGPGLTRLGLLPEQLVGKTVDDVLPPEKAEQIKPYLRRAFAGEEVALKLSLGEEFFFSGSKFTSGGILPGWGHPADSAQYLSRCIFGESSSGRAGRGAAARILHLAGGARIAHPADRHLRAGPDAGARQDRRSQTGRNPAKVTRADTTIAAAHR
jgi:hypothetical protein